MFKKRKAPEMKTFELHYDDVAEHVFTCLIDMGYAPNEDELFDIADIVFDFAVNLHLQLGGETEIRYVDSEGETD